MATRTPALHLTVFKSGNSAALRLPKGLGFAPGQRVLAVQRGDALVLRHADALGWPAGYFESWEGADLELPERAPAGSREQRLRRLFPKLAKKVTKARKGRAR